MSSSTKKRGRNDEEDVDTNDKRKIPGHGGIIVYKNPRRLPVQRSTVCLLAGLQGKYVNVELKNNNEIYGKIDNVDNRMNIEMSDVKLKTSTSSTLIPYEAYILNGNLIRYVHIPRNVDIKETVKVFIINL
jgi:small nuclear ribonucleoprotein (snRNP)-like protein